MIAFIILGVILIVSVLFGFFANKLAWIGSGIVLLVIIALAIAMTTKVI